MKKAIAKKLRSIAAGLPTVFERHRTGIMGFEILKDKPDAKDTDGKPIHDKRRYSTVIAKPVNHEARLKQIWEQAHGDKDKAVAEYVAAAHELHRSQQQQINKKAVAEVQSV